MSMLIQHDFTINITHKLKAILTFVFIMIIIKKDIIYFIFIALFIMNWHFMWLHIQHTTLLHIRSSSKTVKRGDLNMDRLAHVFGKRGSEEQGSIILHQSLFKQALTRNLRQSNSSYLKIWPFHSGVTGQDVVEMAVYLQSWGFLDDCKCPYVHKWHFHI